MSFEKVRSFETQIVIQYMRSLQRLCKLSKLQLYISYILIFMMFAATPTRSLISHARCIGCYKCSLLAVRRRLFYTCVYRCYYYVTM